MKRVSTHVLDTALGKPATGIAVRLERLHGSDDWQLVGSSHTDQDGRCANLLSHDCELAPGTYRISFDTASYHGTQKLQGLYPVVQVTFAVRDGETHFHIPLLLSPHGFTTYRGT
jgi:5-hydroxyisourate hydrolase